MTMKSMIQMMWKGKNTRRMMKFLKCYLVLLGGAFYFFL